MRLIALLALLALLGACNSNNDDTPGTSESTAPPPTRGTLIENPPPRIASFTTATLLDVLTAGTVSQEILKLVAAPKCGVDVHQIRYNTVDATDKATTASGALMIPTGTDSACQGARPVAVYAHGTVAEKSFNIADLSSQDNIEGLLIAAVFASHGYIVVAPNYAGYDTSSLDYHPYLHADQQSKDTADALSAARSALPTSFAPTIVDAGKLFITGYSQGGFVAMATHRLLQQSGATVTASAPMSGPYALGAFGDAVFYGQVPRNGPPLVSWVITAYQRAYGNIYANPTDVFDPRYATGIDTLLPTTGTRSDLFAQGRLPREQLFSSTPPDPAFAQYTPPTTPADLAPVFARGFGPEALITNSYRLTFLQDAQLHPDGGFPTLTNNQPADAPANNLRVAFKANDLRNWTPTAPVLLCAGDEDPTVFYFNTDLMQRYWAGTGASSVRVLDVDGSIALNDPDAVIKAGFAAAKETVAAAAVAGGATDGGAAAVADAYHSTLVPPFCLTAVQSFFDAR
jgi:pimeloyl-ACP methyl ester carboxylesterase